MVVGGGGGRLSLIYRPLSQAVLLVISVQGVSVSADCVTGYFSVLFFSHQTTQGGLGGRRMSRRQVGSGLEGYIGIYTV